MTPLWSPAEPFYDAGTRRFARGAIRYAAVMRQMTLHDLGAHARLSPSTMYNALAGRSVSDTTAMAIFTALAHKPAMEIH